VERGELVVGTRGSALARWQSEHVVKRLVAASGRRLRCRLETISTAGDRDARPLPQIGGKGVFTGELERGLLERRFDLAVHSLKDLPIEPSAGLVLPAILDREDVRDVLISRDRRPLDALAAGAVIGTSSPRRQAQLLAARADLQVSSIRGNVETRIEKVERGDYDAVVLAAAGVRRLGLEERVSEWLSLATMLPAPGQGALAVQCRADDQWLIEKLRAIDEPGMRRAVDAERSFLARLGGGCSLPVAAFGTVKRPSGSSAIFLSGLVASVDGRQVVRVEGEGEDGVELGRSLAEEALERGAGGILSVE
jgi:hydroxymethylbilane synthase